MTDIVKQSVWIHPKNGIVPEGTKGAEEYIKLNHNRCWYWDSDDPEYGFTDLEERLSEIGDDRAVAHVAHGFEFERLYIANKVLSVDNNGDPEETEVAEFRTEKEAAACFPQSYRERLSEAGFNPDEFLS